MKTDHERLDRLRADPAILRRFRSLTRLKSVVTIMNTGAHPDDEHNSMLALLRYRDGIRTVVACSTRGEGGQNALGPERGGALGAIRSREMEEAAREIDAGVVWLGHGPDDPVHDFGFAKSGEATLARWGEARILERLVHAYRQERPDIVIPTFLDVPGQHGHHRAMTACAERAIALAADPAAFPGLAAEGLTPWRVAKFYLPAWSGGGDTYDDEVPPPEATLRLRASGNDAGSGASFDRIGEYSRRFHATQGMGRMRTRPRTEWALHLVGGEGETDITHGLPTDLAALAEGAEDFALRATLRDAAACVEDAIVSFPIAEETIRALAAAGSALDRARSMQDVSFRALHGHRIDRKLREIDFALVEASGFVCNLSATAAAVRPGERAVLDLVVEDPGSSELRSASLHCPASCRETGRSLTPSGLEISFEIDGDAEPTPIFQPGFDPLRPTSAIGCRLDLLVGGREVVHLVDPEFAVSIVPRHTARAEPRIILQRTGEPIGSMLVRFEGRSEASTVTIRPPSGWRSEPDECGLRVLPPARAEPGRITIPLEVDGDPLFRRDEIGYAHISPTAYQRPETLEYLVLDLVLPPGTRIGYVGGGADTVEASLRMMGLDVIALADDDLVGDLSRFTTIIVGLFAFKLRPALTRARDRLHQFVEDGGNLLTLYHRPWDNWDRHETAPRELAIGSPSLRWRVSEPDAAVEILNADHPLMSGPNRIGVGDFYGWDKERGLYFASHWDPAYEPLLAMSDRGEAPLEGALLSARIGRGRHTHTSLVLHHQMERLVPGAYRLMANLVQPAR